MEDTSSKRMQLGRKQGVSPDGWLTGGFEEREKEVRGQVEDFKGGNRQSLGGDSN